MAIKKSSGSGIPFGGDAGRPANPGIGQLYSNGEAQRLELYTTGGWNNIVQEVPGVSGIQGNYLESSNSGTIIVIGTNFANGAIVSAIGTNGVEVLATSTTYNSLVQLTAAFNGLSGQYEPYNVKVMNPSNLFGVLPNALYVNATPVWQTVSGSLGTFNEQVAVSVSATATDSDSTISYSLASGSSLPAGLTLNSSSGLISGTLTTDISSDTTYSFTINASDGVNAAVPRSFSLNIVARVNVELLIAAGGGGTGYDVGGGGGGGGLIDTTRELTRGATYSISIGTGGASAQTTSLAYGLDGGNTIAFGLTAIGGGGGGYYANNKLGRDGGSGGGAGMDAAGGTALQPSSASVGYGFNGGSAGGAYGSGGGGGAGGVGGNGAPNTRPAGGLPRYSSITGSSVGYSGGGFGNDDGGALVATGLTTSGTTLGYYGFGANGTGNPNASPYNGNPGVVIIAYPNTLPAITTIPGTLTYDQPTRSGYRVYRFTAGSGTITF